jgi:hypothetical protein
VTFHIIVNHVWRHDGAKISVSALLLGGLVISTKGKPAKW